MTALSYPAPLGPHPVGVSDAELVDTAYPVLRPQDAGGRRLMVRSWYPAATADGRRRPYFTGVELDVLGLGVSGDRPPLVPREWILRMGRLLTHSVQDAEPAAGRFPTLIFSHGARGYVSQNTPLMEHLASHGYVVWSVAHPGEAGGIVYPDGDVLRSDDEFDDALQKVAADALLVERGSADIGLRLDATRQMLDDRHLGRWARRWVDDQRAVLDAIDTDSLTSLHPGVVAASDLERVGVFGMSFGGAAAAATAQVDVRVRAAANLDGGEFLSDLLNCDVRVPFLELTSDAAALLTQMGIPANFLSYNEFFYEPIATAGMRDDVFRLRVADVTHRELTDFLLFPAVERAAAIPGGGQADGGRTVALLNAFIGKFFDAVLKGQGDGFPAVQLGNFPEVKPLDLAPLREWAKSHDGITGGSLTHPFVATTDLPRTYLTR